MFGLHPPLLLLRLMQNNTAMHEGCQLINKESDGLKRKPKKASHHVIKAANRYVVQGSDTTMLTIAASLFGQ